MEEQQQQQESRILWVRIHCFQYQPMERAFCKTLHQSLQMLHPVTIDMQSYEKRRRETKGWILLKALNVHLKCLNVCKAVFLLVIIMWFPSSLNFENLFLKVWNRVWRIYSNIWIFEYFWSEYSFGYLFKSKFWYKYIRIFVRINFQDTNRFRRCFYWFSLDIILCLWIFCWYQW